MKNLHIGIIPDGNRRYSKSRGMKTYEGYYKGLDNINNILENLSNYDQVGDKVKMITMYVASINNLTKRESEETEELYNAMRYYLKSPKIDIIHKNEINVKFVGHLHLLPQDLQNDITKLQQSTQNYQEYYFNLAIGYDGKQEILDTINKIVRDSKTSPVSYTDLSSYLYISDEIDLVIRTGKEKRSSGFFPLQTTYAEWFYFDKMWPEFTFDDFKQCISDFEQRSRRFGL